MFPLVLSTILAGLEDRLEFLEFKPACSCSGRSCFTILQFNRFARKFKVSVNSAAPPQQKPITQTASGFNGNSSLGFFQLFSKVGDIDTQVMPLILSFRAPDRTQQVSAGDHLARIGDERVKQRLFGGCEINSATT